MLKAHWWKAFAVILLLYVMTVGMITPLSVGITHVSPNKAVSGSSFTLEIVGYNSHFKNNNTRAWLKIDSATAYCAESVAASDDTHLNATFSLPFSPADAPAVTLATLVLDNPKDGFSVFPAALSIQAKTDSLSNETKSVVCEIIDLHENTAYDFPFRNILMETIRNLYFHVPLWFGMLILFLVAAIYSIRYLRNFDMEYDIKAAAFVRVGILYGLLGLLTGGIWAKYTWGQFWSFDIKQNMSAIAMFIYFAYFILRGSFEDEQQKARLGAIYNIFAFASLIPLLFVIPRLYDSLHPGNGGNPAFGGEDLDNTMRTVFYPAVIGWTLLGTWIATLIVRMEKVKWRILDK